MAGAELQEGDAMMRDFTQLPKQLDAKLALLDLDAALRPTKIKTGPHWSKKAQTSLLGKVSHAQLSSSEQDEETQKAFDLLDALSRSGALPIECASPARDCSSDASL